jgi:hypothetical protein
MSKHPSLDEHFFICLFINGILIGNHFLKWMVIVASIFSFIIEPVLEWIEVYKELKWKHIYSFPI